MPVAVVVFESTLLTPRQVRHDCAAAALDGLQFAVEGDDVLARPEAVEGLTFEEYVETHLAHHPSHRARVEEDPTLLDLVVLEAHTRFARWLQDGAQLPAAPDAIIRTLSRGHTRRLILRADSRRRDVLPFLERWRLHDAFAMVRCADDPPCTPTGERHSAGRSWEAIVERLARWRVTAEAVEIIGESAPIGILAQRLVTGIQLRNGGY